jgi:hypothetical protein
VAERLDRQCFALRINWPNWIFAFATFTSATTIARGDLFENYRPVRQFDLPAGAEMFDALADGRVIAIADANVYVETGPSSSNFSLVGALPAADIPGFGAAFLRVSPDGQRIAVGNNGGAFGDNYQVGIFDVTTLAGDWFTASHFDAEWFDDSLLAIAAGDFGSPSIVTVLDTASPDPQDPSNVLILDNIGGASGGIAFDGAGNLYTGNGFQSTGPSGTGAVKAFLLSDWLPILSGGSPLHFENDGVLIVDILSASPLDFDIEGNLAVSGGDFSSSEDKDFVAVISAPSVAAALMGSGPVSTSDPQRIRHLDPLPGNDFNFFTASTNDTLQQLYVRDFGSPTVYVYADAPAVPAITTWGAVVMALTLLSAATLVLTRRATLEAGPRSGGPA